MKKNKTMIVVFLTPAVLLFLGIFLYPIIRTVIMSFFKIDGVTDSMDLWKFVGFGNYTKLMSTSLFNNRSKNSLTSIGDGMNCTFEHVCSNS